MPHIFENCEGLTLTLEKIVPLSMKIARGSFSMMSFGDTFGQASSMTK